MTVTPPSFIIDDASIAILAKLHPQHLTNHQQITVMLDQTVEWEEEWSREIFGVIRQFDQDLLALRQTTATQKKNQQKRIKLTQDAQSFEEAMKENEERIRLQVIQQFKLRQASSPNVQILQTNTSINNLL